MEGDCFAVLGLERRAALGEEAVAAAFQERSRGTHPDLEDGSGEMFGEVNEAYQVLRDPVRRLKHLLEIEFGEANKDAGRGMVSGELLEWFGRIGEVLQGAEVVLKKRAEAQTALGKAMLAKEEMAAQGRLQETGVALNGLLEKELDRLGEVDALLAAGEREGARELGEELAQRLGFLTKWQAKVREKVVAFLTAE